ncbi:hypothetical protein NPIL_414171 [Nephila pilipes]|uniref:Uncharacterized protein n=1 Tax=Nephila pilipes TaxID=299642 RepID=A0A8X6QT97_NEPPI|nr:hypothetical protein NPIL_414171 [Nephila pilipes]
MRRWDHNPELGWEPETLFFHQCTSVLCTCFLHPHPSQSPGSISNDRILLEAILWSRMKNGFGWKSFSGREIGEIIIKIPQNPKLQEDFGEID